MDTPSGPGLAFFLTKGDRSALLQQQAAIQFGNNSNNNLPTIEVDTAQVFQTMDGFGYTLTTGSAILINGLPPADRAALLRELFSDDPNAIRLSYLRVNIGASDLSPTVYSYNDLPAGQTDVLMEHFSLEPDRAHMIPVLKAILAINPSLKILATPWSPPTWMKDNNSSVGGSLKPEYYEAYARYFVKYLQGMEAEGIKVDAITPQNEPLHPGNNPSMHMTAQEQANFIKNNLGPALRTAGLNTRIIIYDHNADRPDYPLSILNDPAAKQYVDGSAFHLYAGSISALSEVRNAHPDRHIYFTEQYTASNGSFGGDLKWHLRNVVVGATRNWARVVLEWNLANDPSFGPHTPGGCTTCLGAVTIANSGLTRNVAYYIIAHASRFVPPGAQRIGSNLPGSLHNVAFRTPAGKKVLIVSNDGNELQSFNIRYAGKTVSTRLDAGAVGTYVWE